MKPTEPSGKIAKMIAAEMKTNFMRVARTLRQLQADDPEGFVRIAKQGGVERRQAYALARIAEQFDGTGIPDERLLKIGWTKLYVLSPRLTDKNIEQLLKAAEQFNVHELKDYLRGEKPKKNARAMLLHLRPKDDERFRIVLKEYGAKPSGTGLVGKEDALAALLDDLEYLMLTERHA